MENTTENWNTRTNRTTHIIYQLPIRALDIPEVHIISIFFHDWGARISRIRKIVSRAKIMLLLIRKANPAVKISTCPFPSSPEESTYVKLPFSAGRILHATALASKRVEFLLPPGVR